MYLLFIMMNIFVIYDDECICSLVINVYLLFIVMNISIVYSDECVSIVYNDEFIYCL